MKTKDLVVANRQLSVKQARRIFNAASTTILMAVEHRVDVGIVCGSFLEKQQPRQPITEHDVHLHVT